MKSLYAQYIAEREGKQIIETDKGFATYQIFDNGECYIEDIYVLPEFRKEHAAAQMADEIAEIARQNECTTLVGSVCVGANGDTASMKVLLAYGMKVHSIKGNMIYFTKLIGVK